MSRTQSIATSRSCLALDNLRAVVILVVLAFHSMLSYIAWIPPRTSGFNDPPFDWRIFPIVDSHRWFGFDLFCAWQDVYLMSLMFFLSGLFVWSSLERKQSWGFVRDRLSRLGLPFVFGVAVLIPLALYPVYLAITPDPSVADYVHRYLALPFLPNGQLWFIWQLLALNFVAAGVHWIWPDALRTLGRWSVTAGRRPGIYFAVLVAASAVAYVPLALVFTQWAWTNSGPFALQWCRLLLYAVYFFAGIGIGTGGIDAGLVAADGALVRRWKLWLVVALVTDIAWMGVTWLTLDGKAPVAIDAAAALCFVVACASGCFCLIAASLRFARRSSVLAALSANAYSLYLVHYVFVIWLQYALLGFALFAVVKAAIVFGGTIFFSWITILTAQRVPFSARLIAAPPRTAELRA